MPTRFQGCTKTPPNLIFQSCTLPKPDIENHTLICWLCNSCFGLEQLSPTPPFCMLTFYILPLRDILQHHLPLLLPVHSLTRSLQTVADITMPNALMDWIAPWLPQTLLSSDLRRVFFLLFCMLAFSEVICLRLLLSPQHKTKILVKPGPTLEQAIHVKCWSHHVSAGPIIRVHTTESGESRTSPQWLQLCLQNNTDSVTPQETCF